MDSSNRPLALVTGASSGIGAELARELARHGHDLVLTARRVTAMEALATELRGLGAAATVIAADLSKPDAAATLAGDIASRGFDVDVLVNNAGLGALGRFDRMDFTRISEMLQVNIVALMLVSSVAGFQPGPRMAVYFASKAYVTSLGEALAYELRGTGIGVTVLCPGATDTEFFATAGADDSIMARRLRHMMRAADVARIGYRALAAGRRVVIAGIVNKVLALAGRFAPHRISLPVTDKLMMSPRD